MNNERTPRDHRTRNVGAVGILALAAFVGGAALTGGFRGSEANARASYTPGPTSAELATPTTSQAAGSAGPESSSSPEASKDAFLGIPFGRGQVLEVFPGDVISGDDSMADIKVDIKDQAAVEKYVRPMYDQDTNKKADVTDTANTALFIDVQAHGFVYGDNGGYIARGLTGDQRDTYIALQRNAKLRGGFKSADVVTWTGYATTRDEAGNLPQEFGQSNPGASLSPDGSTGSTGTGSVNSGSEFSSVSAQAIAGLAELIQAGGDKINLQDPNIVALLNEIAACGCSVKPTESPAPLQSPVPSINPNCEPWTDKIMTKGETKTFTVYGFASLGDDLISINGGPLVRYYDSNPQTAAIDRKWFGQPTTVKVWSKEGGTDFQQFNSCATKADFDAKVSDDIAVTQKTGKSIDTQSLK